LSGIAFRFIIGNITMAIVYKTLSFSDTPYGRKEMSEAIDQLVKEGWELKNKTISSQGWSFWKTMIFGFIFLPLALLGRNSNLIEIIMEKS